MTGERARRRASRSACMPEGGSAGFFPTDAWIRIGWIGALALALFTCAEADGKPRPPPAAAPVTVWQSGTATLEDVPPIPDSVIQDVRRYQDPRAAEFEGWLADGSLLIATRFGDTRQLHRVAHPGGARQQLTFFSEPVNDAITVAGTSRFIAVIDQGGDEWFQLVSLVPGSAPLALTEPGTRNESPVASRDGSLLVWSRAAQDSAGYELLRGDPARADGIEVVYRDTGSVQPADIAPDNRTLLFLRTLSNRESELRVLDLATREVRPAVPEMARALYLDPLYTPDGQQILVISDEDGDFRHVREIDLASGRSRDLTPQLRRDVDDIELSPDGRTLACAVNDEGYSRVVLIDRATLKPLLPPTLPHGVVSRMKFSADGRRLAVGLSTPIVPGDVWTWSLEDGRVERWTESELGTLSAAALVEPALVQFQSFDGLTIPAFVYRPRDAAPGARTPVIMDIHGGPESQTRPMWNPGAQYFTAVLGATVIQPNVRGSAGYGKRYLDLDNAGKREDTVRDIGALLDWIAAQPDLDAGRVAVYGQSYGGYMSLATMTHYASRLVGGVERYGISDFVSFLRNTQTYRRDLRRAEYGDERDPEMRRVFERISPLANVAKICRPMLVMQGANDPRVPKSESDQIVAGIRANGVPAWYVVFADEGHGFRKRPNDDLRRAVETMFLADLFAPEGGTLRRTDCGAARNAR